jgi:hypothetical protein
MPAGSVPDQWNWIPLFHVPPGSAAMSKVESLKLTRTQSASDPSALRYQIVASMTVASVPVRGETLGSKRRFGPLEARTGRTVVANRSAAAHKALTQVRALRPPVRRSLTSTSAEPPRPGELSPVHAENGPATRGQQWYGGPGATSDRVDGRPMRDRWCADAPTGKGPVGSGWATGSTGWSGSPGWLIGSGSLVREPRR